MADLTFRLLALCARSECSPGQLRSIARMAPAADWANVPGLAEAHGITPLVHRHLTASGVQVAPPVRRELQALAVRHRSASAVRTRVLQEILLAFGAAEIGVLLLKGAALAYLLYPEPGLRPMRDIDLLVSRKDAARAQRLLGELGFDAPLSQDGHAIGHRHLPNATRATSGFTISVEVHQTLFEPEAAPQTLEFEELPSQSFYIGECPAATLNDGAMLWYLCQHLIESTNIFSSVGLIWVADIVGYAERYRDRVDWERVAAHSPLVPHTLALLHFLTPLSEDLIARAHLSIGQEPPGLWNDFRKGPRTTPEERFATGYRGAIAEALAPSEWWLRLTSGLGSAAPLRSRHRVQHMVYLVRRFHHLARRQKKK